MVIATARHVDFWSHPASSYLDLFIGSARAAYCKWCCTKGALHSNPCIVHNGSNGLCIHLYSVSIVSLNNIEELILPGPEILKVLLTKGLIDWPENFHSPQEDDRKWTGCSMLLTSWVPLCNQWASDGGWSLPYIFPYWLGTWFLYWNYLYCCSAFLKVMYLLWVTTEITAVILVPGKKLAYACTSSNSLTVDITHCSAWEDHEKISRLAS